MLFFLLSTIYIIYIFRKLFKLYNIICSLVFTFFLQNKTNYIKNII